MLADGGPEERTHRHAKPDRNRGPDRLLSSSFAKKASRDERRSEHAVHLHMARQSFLRLACPSPMSTGVTLTIEVSPHVNRTAEEAHPFLWQIVHLVCIRSSGGGQFQRSSGIETAGIVTNLRAIIVAVPAPNEVGTKRLTYKQQGLNTGYIRCETSKSTAVYSNRRPYSGVQLAYPCRSHLACRLQELEVDSMMVAGGSPSLLAWA